MNKKKVIIILVVIVVLIFVINNFTGASVNASGVTEDGTVIYDDLQYVDSTGNLFTIVGHFLSNGVSYLIQKVFWVINRLLEFAFGI